MLRHILTRSNCSWRRSISLPLFTTQSPVLSQLQNIRSKFINFGIQGNRDSKQKYNVKRKFGLDIDDNELNEHLENLVNIEEDA